MKKIFTSFMVIMLSVFLINISINNVFAEENNETVSNTLVFAYKKESENATPKWSFWLETSDDVFVEYTKGKGETWSVDGSDIANPVITFNNFEYSGNEYTSEVIAFYPNRLNDNLTIVLNGKNTITGNYQGDDFLRLINIYDLSDEEQGKFEHVNFVGMGDNPELNLIDNGHTTKLKEDSASARGIDIDNEKVLFKDLKVTVANGDAEPISQEGVGSVTALAGTYFTELVLDNADVTLIGGKTPTDYITQDIHLGFGIGQSYDVKDKINLVLKNNSKITLIGSLAAAYTSQGIDLKDYDVKYYSTQKGGEENEVTAKFNPDYQFGGFESMGTYTFEFTIPGTNDKLEVPCPRMEIVEGKTPTPTPSPKDESCEKVIGPTWHWNNAKGVCEEYATVGTATR